MLTIRPLRFIGVLLALFACKIDVFAVDPSSTITQYAHKSWRITEAGLQSAPKSIAQTRDGYIWVGTVDGLFRFNGMRFTLWTPPNDESFRGREVTHLFGARDGSLYIGAYDGAARLLNGRLDRLNVEAENPGPFVEDKAGKVWFTHIFKDTDASAFCSVDRENVTCYGKRDGTACLENYAALSSADGALWVGGKYGICRKTGAGTWDKFPLSGLAHDDASSEVVALAEDKSNVKWAGISGTGPGKGLLRFSNGKWTSYISTSIDGRRLEIERLLVDSRGSLWIGTVNAGLYRLCNGRTDHFTNADGLTGNRIIDLIEDREGSIWAVTNRGIDQFHDLPVTSFTTREGLSADEALALATSDDGTVWVGNKGAVDAIGNDRIWSIHDQKLFGNSNISSLLIDSEGALWVATGSQVAVYRDGRFQIVKGRHGSDIGLIAVLQQDTQHSIWASGDSGGPISTGILHRIRGTKEIDELPSPGGHTTDQVIADPKGGLWLGVYGHGLFRFSQGEIKRADFISKETTVTGLLLEAGGALWVGTGDGIVRADRERVQTLDTHNGIPCNAAYGLIEDDSRDLWVEMQCGLVRIAQSEIAHWWADAQYHPQYTLFGTTAGFSSSLGVSPPVRSKDGRLWFLGAGDIVYTIDPKHIPRNTVAPPVKIEQFVADHKEYSVSDRILLPKLTRDIEVSFAGLSYVSPDDVEFRYKLDGHDKDWVDAGHRRQAFYNDLAPGFYELHVMASNNDRVRSETDSTLSFEIPPTWYQTYWFKLVEFVCLILIVYLVYRIRMRSYAKSVKMRFDERLNERTRLARELHDTLLQTIQGSKIAADNAREAGTEPERMRAALDRLSEWLGRATFEGRQALHSLRISSAETSDLESAFRETARDCQFVHPAKVCLSVLGESRGMHPDVQEEVFRIGYEAIRNACAHSGGNNVEVELEYGRNFCLRIRDDGHGIEQQTLDVGKAGHFGLVGMRERADRIRAELVMLSTLSGTEVSLTVPGKSIFIRK